VTASRIGSLPHFLSYKHHNRFALPWPDPTVKDYISPRNLESWSKGVALANLLRRTGPTEEADRLEVQRTELWNHRKDKLPNAQFLLRQSLSQVSPRAAFRSAATH